jgi:hypothetical protein
VAGLWVFLGTTVSSTNKTDCHNITEILLKVALNTTAPTLVKYCEDIDSCGFEMCRFTI